MFYRATNEIVFKLIDDICTKLSDYDNIEFFSMISFIHKVFLSEICCCKYSLNSNEEKVNLIDSNCEKNFLERRSQIFGRFLKKGLLDILVTAYEKFDLSQSCIMKIIGLITIIIDTREFILNNTCFVTKIFRIKSSMEHIVFIPKFLEKSNFTEIHMQKNGSVPILKSKKNIFKQIDYTKYLRLDFGYLKGKHSNSKILHDFAFNDKNLHIKEFNNDLEDLDSFKLLSKLFCVNLHGKMFDKTIKKIYPENSSTVRDEYDASDLENIHFNFLGTYLQDISCEDGFKTHKLSNIGKEERFKFSDFLTEEKLSNIFLRLLIFFKGRKEACILNNIKSIISVCSNHKLLGSFNYFLIKNIETYEKVQNDQIISYRLEILRLIVIDYQFIIRFKTDSLNFNVLIFVLIDKTNEYFLKFDRKTHLRSLISIFLSENISNENSFVEFLLLNMNQINEKHLSLGFYFGLKTILFYVEMMKDKICKIFLPFDNDKENNLDFFVFKEFETFLEKFHDFKFELTVDFLEEIIDYSIKLSQEYLAGILIELFKDGVVAIEYIFKYTWMYFLKVSEQDKFERLRNHLILKYLMAFIFNITYQTFYETINEDNDCIEVEDLDRELSKLYNFKLFENLLQNIFHYTDIETKKLILRNKFNRSEYYFRGINFKVTRSEIFNSTINILSQSNLMEIRYSMWFITFRYESGQGIGLIYDFFTLFGKEVNQNKYFEAFRTLDYYDISNLNNENENFIKKAYYFLGIIMAKCVAMNYVLGLELIDSFYLYSLKDKVTFEDLKYLDYEFYENINKCNLSDDIDSFGLYFTVNIDNLDNEYELKPNGSNISVTTSNLKEYLQLITEFKLFKNMNKYLKEMKKGFKFILNEYLSFLFTLDELKLFIEGERAINIDEWMSSTNYIGDYHKDHHVIVWFWKFVKSSNEEIRKKILYFVTALEKLPIGGFQSQKFILKGFSIESTPCKELFPSSQTCVNLLILPCYDDEETLIKKFMIALENKEYGKI
ncbi:HECT domain-containing ubiquitin-transferase [Hamiltosporidium tvaerminnensis]|uniref:HECT-type E3 ubiquitin transferase n=1 Tax=Hamiltosporidium tvaerminnensis TaxID=1176355 RepID=A0A4Q9LPM5_9MICR|nr:HECT domain-containing ubiquitin-transferase [Hamiltosporidium tvaerminnensis]